MKKSEIKRVLKVGGKEIKEMINFKLMRYVDGRILKGQVKKEKHQNLQWDNCLIIEFF